LDVVKAAGQLQQMIQGKRVHLLFAGSGELGEELRKSCNVIYDIEAKAALSQNVKDDKLPSASFVGFLNQTKISKAYVAADCMVLPSDAGETWGLVINEAMASGLPCVVSKMCGCGED